MTLQNYIKEVSPQKFAKTFDITLPHAYQLLNYKYAPSSSLAYKIYSKTKGRVSYEGMFLPHAEAKFKKAK